ncbi:MAG: hypothetical protein AAGA09_05520 [Pseudomonadota bacterium]
MAAGNDNRVVWRVGLPCARERAFAALATREGREAFWAETAPEHDGAIHFAFPNGVKARSAVLQNEPPSLYEIDYFGMPTRFTLEGAAPDKTVLTVDARNIPDADFQDVHAGWVSVLMAMKCWLATGYDLRNHDVQQSWDQRFVEN